MGKKWYFVPTTVAGDNELSEAIEKSNTYMVDALTQQSFGKSMKKPSLIWATTAGEPAKNVTGSKQVPNNVATSDPTWNNKLAWNSVDLLERQKQLATYSSEVAMLFEAVRQIISKASDRYVPVEVLDFIADFGSPIINNEQKITITLRQPFELQLIVIRKLVDGKLSWACDAWIQNATPVSVEANLERAKNEGPIELDSVVKDGGERRKRQRKVRL